MGDPRTAEADRYGGLLEITTKLREAAVIQRYLEGDLSPEDTVELLFDDSPAARYTVALIAGFLTQEQDALANEMLMDRLGEMIQCTLGDDVHVLHDWTFRKWEDSDNAGLRNQQAPLALMLLAQGILSHAQGLVEYDKDNDEESMRIPTYYEKDVTAVNALVKQMQEISSFEYDDELLAIAKATALLLHEMEETGDMKAEHVFFAGHLLRMLAFDQLLLDGRSFFNWHELEEIAPDEEDSADITGYPSELAQAVAEGIMLYAEEAALQGHTDSMLLQSPVSRGDLLRVVREWPVA